LIVIFISSFSAPSATALAEVEQYRKSLIRGRGVDGEGYEDEKEQRKKIEIERARTCPANTTLKIINKAQNY
jgi:hypothetical protein